MKKRAQIWCIMLLGIMLIVSQSFAFPPLQQYAHETCCAGAKTSAVSCCEKMDLAKTVHHKTKNNDCNSNCKNMSCFAFNKFNIAPQALALGQQITIPVATVWPIYSDAYPLAGFHSIWQPPKLG
ncbi:hypothetical protein ACL9RF_12615 [Sphingobacterium sp. Mn56C]|uniref:hypothetical protein n=1 Tax=Sphingobacterium sp. Mn56C TaxID=3395261 RepID=UPI003BC665A1